MLVRASMLLWIVMNLTEIFTSIREEKLGRTQLEMFEQKLAGIYADYMIEIGSLKKQRALYFLERQRPEITDISIRRQWDAIPDGQRLIELEANVKAVARMSSSVRSRIYQSL